MPTPKDTEKYKEWIKKLKGREPPNKLKIPKKELFKLYVNRKLSIHRIAEIFNCSPPTISSRLKKEGWIRSLSESLKGKPSSQKGKSFEERFGIEKASKIRDKMSKSLKGKFTGTKHHFYGKRHTEETKKKISISKKGQKLTKEQKIKQGMAVSKIWETKRKGKTYKEIFGGDKAAELIKKLSESHKGKHSSPDTQFKKGSIPWNKGKVGASIAWNKGLKAVDNPSLLRAVKAAHKAAGTEEIDLENFKDKIIKLYNGGYDTRELAKLYNVSQPVIRRRLIKWEIPRKKPLYGIKSELIVAKDGHKLQSTGELIICNFLSENKIHHLCRKKIPSTKLSYDFYIPIINKYIEFLGLDTEQIYRDKKINRKESTNRKIKTYQEKKLNVLFIWPKDNIIEALSNDKNIKRYLAYKF